MKGKTSMNRACICGGNMRSVALSSRVVYICDNCNIFDIHDIECEHEKGYACKLEMADERHMVKMYCPECKSVYGKPLKQDNFDLGKLPVSSFEKYYAFREELQTKENIEIEEITTGMVSIRTALSEHRFNIKRDEYAEYLKSDKWAKMRERAFVRDGHKCQICGKTAQQVHHLTYAHIYNEFIFEVVSLCEDCHYTHYHADKKI